MSGALPQLGDEDVRRLLSPPEAVDALEAALLGGLDPDVEPARVSVGGEQGELLLMPSWAGGALGVKLASVAPGNPERGLPRIQGVHVVFDPQTLAPVALIDGIALTSLRTAAVSGLAVRRLAPEGARRLLVFGSGAQALSHVEAIRRLRPIERVDVVARDRRRLATFVKHCRSLRLSADPSEPAAVEHADVVCCATTAREPLFDGGLARPGTLVVAVGSHEPEAREVDATLVRRSTAVVVETRAGALREAGDVIQAVRSGDLDPGALVSLAQLVRGELRPGAGPWLFKSTGMAWEDAVIGAELWRRLG